MADGCVHTLATVMSNHMAFTFADARIYMALRQEDRLPITEITARTRRF